MTRQSVLPVFGESRVALPIYISDPDVATTHHLIVEYDAFGWPCKHYAINLFASARALEQTMDFDPLEEHRIPR
jgi:hypothetical protein